MPAPDLYAGSPYLGELRNSLIYGEIWERPQLSKRDRSLITIAALQALTREELAIHVRRGLDNGLSPEEISEIILHVTFYAGWPTGVQASVTAAAAFEERGLSLGELPGAPPGASRRSRAATSLMLRCPGSGSCATVWCTAISGSGRCCRNATAA